MPWFKYPNKEMRNGRGGASVLDEACSYFKYKVTGSIERGDHSVFIDEVVEAESRRDEL